MSIDILQEKIRKLKNPVVIDLTVKPDKLPKHILDAAESLPLAYERFCAELMEGLSGKVPALRFPFSAYAMLDGGLSVLKSLLEKAREMDFYTILDGPELLTPWQADLAAQNLFGGSFACDALVISPYIGSDAIRPFLLACKEDQKDLFVVIRSPNKSASELQDLMTGTRLVHGAVAETVNRLGEGNYGKFGYSRIAAAVSAGAPQSIRTLRTKHNRMFLLVDGLDYPSGNAKNCSFAFDRFGYGAAVCAGPSVTCAWQEGEGDGSDYVGLAVQSVERIKKNLSRYFDIL